VTNGEISEFYRLYKKIAKATNAAVMTQRIIFLLLLLLFSSAIAEVQHISEQGSSLV
jgi:hypothetical protein